MLEIARRLSRRWPVDVHAFTLDDDLGRGWGEVRFHRIRPGVRRPVLLKSTLFYGATLPGLWLLPRLKSGGGPVRPLIHATGACSLVSDVVQVQFVNAAWKTKREELPDAAGWLARTYHSALLDYNIAVERAVYTRSKSYIAIARTVAEELREHFGLERNVHVIHHGVDTESFRPVDASNSGDRERLRRSFGIGADDVVVGFVGSFARKGLGVAIEALRLLAPEVRTRVRLLAVGGGDRATFEEQARRAGLADRVVFAGSTREVQRFFRAFDVFLLPTLYEPFGLVILEAMASALPCVVSACAGAAELIRDAESGSLIRNPSDAAEIARRLAPLLEAPSARTVMGSAARSVALKRTWDQVADEYARVLGPLLSEAEA